MSRFGPLLKRLRNLEPSQEEIEPWPPDVEGSLSKVLYDQLRDEGVELPVERPDEPFMYLLMKGAEGCWSEEVAEDVEVCKP